MANSLLRRKEEDVVLVERLILGAANFGEGTSPLDRVWLLSEVAEEVSLVLLVSLLLLLSSLLPPCVVVVDEEDQPIPLIRRKALAQPPLPPCVLCRRELVAVVGLVGVLQVSESLDGERVADSVVPLFLLLSLTSAAAGGVGALPLQYEIVRRLCCLPDVALPNKLLESVRLGAGPGPGLGAAGVVDFFCCLACSASRELVVVVTGVGLG